MPTVTVYYVSFGGGSGRKRQPRTSGNPIGLTQFPGSPSVYSLSPGQALTGYVLPTTFGVGNATFRFALVNVTGGAPNAAISYDTASPPQVTVGSQPIVVLVIYVPQGGGVGDDWGASIDSLDISTNTLISPDFVSVAHNGQPDPTGTTTGNVDGWVDTSVASEIITAYQHVNPPLASFVAWVDLLNPLNHPGADAGVTVGGQSGADLTVTARTNAFGLAYYQSSGKGIVKEKDKEHIKEHSKEFKEVDFEHKRVKEWKDAEKTVAQEFGGFGPPVGGGGDPGFAGLLVRVLQGLERIEEAIVASQRSFITPEERPPVGEQIREGPEDEY